MYRRNRHPFLRVSIAVIKPVDGVIYLQVLFYLSLKLIVMFIISLVDPTLGVVILPCNPESFENFDKAYNPQVVCQVNSKCDSIELSDNLQNSVNKLE